MTVNDKNENSAEARPAGIKSFLENLLNVRKDEFIREKNDNQLNFIDLNSGHVDNKENTSAGNQPIYRIKIHIKG